MLKIDLISWLFFISLSKLWNTSNNIRFDFAFIVASFDFKSSMITPRVIPGVDTKPVGNIVFDTPANKLNSVSSQTLSSVSFLIDSRWISREIIINFKVNFQRSIEHKFWHNYLRIGFKCERLYNITFILQVINGLIGVASSIACGSLEIWYFTAIGVLSINMMIARRERVGSAPLVISIDASCHDSVGLEVLPGQWGPATVATVSTFRTARQ